MIEKIGKTLVSSIVFIIIFIATKLLDFIPNMSGTLGFAFNFIFFIAHGYLLIYAINSYFKNSNNDIISDIIGVLLILVYLYLYFYIAFNNKLLWCIVMIMFGCFGVYSTYDSIKNRSISRKSKNQF